jgi:hypothetical protein
MNVRTTTVTRGVAKGITAVTNNGECLALFDELAWRYYKSACLEMKVVTVFVSPMSNSNVVTWGQ